VRSDYGVGAMPLRNRVTPLGEIVADPGRGLLYGNRGCLHDPDGTIRRRYNGRRWIACLLEFKGRRRVPLVQPGRYTGLFFLDEATAFAAGHRPCAYCRREEYERFVELWRELQPGRHDADAIDAQLHAERLDPATRAHRLHGAALDELPDGAFVLYEGRPHLVRGPDLLRWSASGYVARSPRPEGLDARAITPPSLQAVLHAGWLPLVPFLHPSATR
jgi:hypothetical protein